MNCHSNSVGLENLSESLALNWKEHSSKQIAGDDGSTPSRSYFLHSVGRRIFIPREQGPSRAMVTTRLQSRWSSQREGCTSQAQHVGDKPASDERREDSSDTNAGQR